MDKSKAATDAGLDGGAGAAAAMAAVVADAKRKKAMVAPVADQEAAEGVAKEKLYKEIDSMYELEQYYEPCEYKTDDDVEEDNFGSYMQRQYTKFEKGELTAMKKGEYFCTFRPSKIKQGDRHSLEMHAMDARDSEKEMKARGDHQALAKILMGDRLPRYGRPASKRARRHL